jgi:hypothetical protein
MIAVIVRNADVIDRFNFFNRIRNFDEARDKRRIAENRVDQNRFAVQTNVNRRVPEP